MKIFGAGMSGLIAAMANPNAEVFERNGPEVETHQALLRFRSEAVSLMTGIKFRKVKVVKSIWSGGREVRPSPRVVALYSNKNTGFYENRSIINIDTVDRYIAPSNFRELLINECGRRIHFNHEIEPEQFKSKCDIISTLPLAINARMLGYEYNTEANKSFIYVNKYKIENCDMFSTVYFPDNNTPVYRASVTGNTLIIESKSKIHGTEDAGSVLESLGLHGAHLELIVKDHKQPMGKLTGINDSERRMMIYKMSHNHGVFSLGRFALHKNILLDDVAKDVRVIKEMMMDDSYGVSIKDRM